MSIKKQAAGFARLFAGLERAHGIITDVGGADDRGKLKARYNTIRKAPTENDWKEHLEGKKGMVPVPIREDDTVCFGAIDVDIYDGFDHSAIIKKIQSVGLPLVTCRSKSGGAHFYLFLDRPGNARAIRDRLDQWATALGFPGVEIFPKQVHLASDLDVGNGIAVPYRGGDRSLQYAMDDDAQALDVDGFIALAESKRSDPDDLPEAEIDLPELDGAPPCLIRHAAYGAVEGDRNNTMFDFAIFCRRKWPEEWEAKAEEMNREYCSPPLPAREMSAIIQSVRRRETYSYRAKCQGQYCKPGACRKAEYGRGPTPERGAEDPGVSVDGMTIVSTDPITCILSIDGIRTELDSSCIMAQDRFRAAVFEKTRRRVSKMKGSAFEALMDRLVENAEYEEAPADAGPRGMLREHLQDFFDERYAEDPEKLRLGHVWYDQDEKVYCFRAKDFMEHLKRRRVSGYRERDVYNAIRSFDGDDSRVRVGRSVIRVWRVAADPPEEPGELDIPDVTKPDDVPF